VSGGDHPTTGLSEAERECLEALARVYLHLNSADADLEPADREEMSRCVRCLQDRVLAQPTKRRLRGPSPI